MHQSKLKSEIHQHILIITTVDFDARRGSTNNIRVQNGHVPIPSVTWRNSIGNAADIHIFIIKQKSRVAAYNVVHAD